MTAMPDIEAGGLEGKRARMLMQPAEVAVELPPDRPEWAIERGTKQAAKDLERIAYETAMSDLAEAQAERRTRRTSITSTGTSLGTRTVADLKYGPPPQPLLPPFFTTGSHVVLYGPGGVGKGTMAAYLIIRYLREDIGNVMILDFEAHEAEWGNRLRGLGITDDEMLRVHYREPSASDWDAPIALAESAELIRDDVARLDVTLVVIDSIVMASDGDPAMGGAAAAKAYFAGLATIGVRSLSLGHVAGASEKWPAKPFGSIYVHALARETWAIERVGEDPSDVAVDDPIAFQNSSSFKVELRNRKNSEGAQQPPCVFDVTYYANGDLSVVQSDYVKTPKDLIRDVLIKTPGLTLDEIVKAIKEDTNEAVSKATVSNTLLRKKDLFVSTTDRRPFKWSLT